MGSWIDLDTPQGTVRAWHAEARAHAAGAVVLIQEIFGVNEHIRDVAERLSAGGFEVLAPSLFDPVERGVELGYDAAGISGGKDLVAALGVERAVDVVGAASRWLANRGRRVGAVGFCWGGSLALLANTRLGLPAVSYYGARSVPFLDEPLRAPMLLHFGSRDSSIPPGQIDLHRQKLLDATIHVYDAGHGFNCDRRADFDADAAALAWERTIEFLRRSLA